MSEYTEKVPFEKKQNSEKGNLRGKVFLSTWHIYPHTNTLSGPRNLFLLVHNRNLPGSQWLTVLLTKHPYARLYAVLDLAEKFLLVVTAVVSPALTMFLNVYAMLFCPKCAMLFFSSSFPSPPVSESSLWFCVRYYFSPVFAFDQRKQEWMYSSTVCWEARALINHRASTAGFINSQLECSAN